MTVNPKYPNRPFMHWKIKAHIQLLNLLVIRPKERTIEQKAEIRRLQTKLDTSSIRRIKLKQKKEKI
jgi:hypothetical protein